VRLAVAEDHLVYRAGLVRVLNQAGFEVVHEARTGRELLRQLRTDVPDIVVLDIRMEAHDDGLVTAEAIADAHAGVGILLLSAYPEYSYAERFFARGTAGRGYALKENFNDVRTIRDALRRIGAGQTYSDPEVLDLMLPRRRSQRLAALLTPRELDILARMAAGMSNAAIAETLSVGLKSVEAATTSIFRKLGLSASNGYNPRVLAVLRWHDEHPGGRVS
jgi:DNA-binding NarL/FixJ family response regulator